MRHVLHPTSHWGSVSLIRSIANPLFSIRSHMSRTRLVGNLLRGEVKIIGGGVNLRRSGGGNR